ncbi:MAG: hypothetical protein OXU20_05335 [Myxococcales bacterium]|nr:hypothetical protein [Myxococcales bacterium]
MTPLERITRRTTQFGHPDAEGTPTYLLSVEDFFDGNEVAGSIGCNLDPMPAPAKFRQALELVAARPEVVDVRVQITSFDDPDWPFSDTVWIITSADEEVVRTWLPEALAPDDVWTGWQPGVTYEDCPVPEGYSPVACWWD